eukprot:2736294-Rhodomonas_salina.1
MDASKPITHETVNDETSTALVGIEVTINTQHATDHGQARLVCAHARVLIHITNSRHTPHSTLHTPHSLHTRTLVRSPQSLSTLANARTLTIGGRACVASSPLARASPR